MLQYLMTSELRRDRGHDPLTLILCDPQIESNNICRVVRRHNADHSLGFRVLTCTTRDIDNVCTLPGHLVVASCGLSSVLRAVSKKRMKMTDVCVVCALSLQFVLEELMCPETTADYIGCMYTYDSIANDTTYHIHQSVSMSVSGNVGTMTWDRDQFVEPAVKSDMVTRGNVVKSTNVVKGSVTSADAPLISRLKVCGTIPIV